jgi:hypothetical protein
MGFINWSHRKPLSIITSSVQKSPTSISKAASVDSLSAQIDTTTPNSTPRRSSEGDQNFLTLTESPRLGAIDSLRKALGDTGSSAVLLSRKEKAEESIYETEGGLSRIEEEDCPPSQMREPLNFENPSWVDFPPTPLSLAVDASADEAPTNDLPDPTTPMEFAQYGYMSRESFTTSVLPLLQPTPDSPIGGHEAASMSPPKVEDVPLPVYYMGTRGIHSNIERFVPPRIEVSSPKNSISGYEKGKRTILTSCSNLSDPCYDSLGVDGISRPQSPNTPAMVTAPQSPKRNLSRHSDNTSFDGPATDNDDISGPKAERGTNRGVEQNPERCFVSRCDANKSTGYSKYSAAMPQVDRALNEGNAANDAKRPSMGSRELLLGGEIPSIDGIGGVLSRQAHLESTNMLTSRRMSEAAGVARLPNGPNAVQPAYIEGIPPAPSLTSALGVPFDGTGMASTPPTPDKRQNVKSRRTCANRGVRKMRKALLRKPILTVVVGRQLAKPTKNMLKLAASGVAFDMPDPASIIPIESPVPAPARVLA